VSKTAQANQLEQLFKDIKQGAEKRGLIVFPDVPAPADAEEGGLIALWDGEWPEFLDLAVKAGVVIAYVHAPTFDLDRRLRQQFGFSDEAEWRTDEDNTEETADQKPWLYHRLIERVGEWSKHNGQVELVECIWLKDGVAHAFSTSAAWSDEFRQAVDEVRTEAREVRASDRLARSTEESTRLYQLAGQLARHERFPEAGSELKRRFMAQQLFPIEIGLHARIADLASIVYWWEVEPEERVTKTEKAQELYARGESLKSIAAMLNMPESKVRSAVVGTTRDAVTIGN
jgi:hypothetical protein